MKLGVPSTSPVLVLLESVMRAGVLPFRGDSMAELMFKIANEEAADIRIIRPDIPEFLANVVALSVSKRPETRYQTGDQFALDLRNVMAAMSGEGTIAPAAAPAEKRAHVDFAPTQPASPDMFDKTSIQQATPPKSSGTSNSTDLEL